MRSLDRRTGLLGPYFPNADTAGRRVAVGGKVQPVYHNVYTSPARWVKTHITVSSITPYGLNDLNSQEINHHPLLTLFITDIILTEIKNFNFS